MKLSYNLFYVEDVAVSMDFYQRAFGLEKGFFHESGQYGEMKTGETKLGFVQHATASSHDFAYDRMSLKKTPAAFELGFTTADVPGAYLKAVKAGATPVSAPKVKPWGQTVSYVRDINGFLIEICSPMG